jgi:hypothetical protein
MISPAFAGLLRSARTDLNARFQAARHRYPDLDGDRLRAFLTTAINPLVTTLTTTAPAATPSVVFAAYDAALDLCGQRLVGPDSRIPAMNAVWQQLLPSALHLLVQAPQRVMVSLGNATLQLATTPGGRADEWLSAMASHAAITDSVDTWLTLGQVLAWRCGLSQYRMSSLSLADNLPPAMLLPIFGAREMSWPALKSALLADPWWTPDGHAPLQETMRIGGFSGFGGPFRELPRVGVLDDQLFVASEEDCWHVLADRYGCTLHRATAREAKALRVSPADEFRLKANQVQWQGHNLQVPDISAINSVAANRDTLLLCSPDTYQVIVVALTGSAA